ncbi:alpha/beta-hydrolase [Cubamyces lactineus]|nr:alpha/beta-hydrolase [Cubamyces lactineus]
MAHTCVHLLLFAICSVVYASPRPYINVQRLSSLSLQQITGYKAYTYYASAAYCPPATTLSWTCGQNCGANPSFIPVASGGDGVYTQYWFVGYDPTLGEIVVSHQGTVIDKIMPDLTDLDLVMTALDEVLFPGVEPPILVHSGFSTAHARSAPDVLSAVRTAMARFHASTITTTGHSLGAAIALLDSVYLPLHIPNVTVRYVGYGLPRVGNWAFADYVDTQSISITHINNREDPIPVLPPVVLGFHHPSGEVHIQDSGEWMACPGQDNPSRECATGAVSVVRFDENDHDGPYDGVEMGCGSRPEAL